MHNISSKIIPAMKPLVFAAVLAALAVLGPPEVLAWEGWEYDSLPLQYTIHLTTGGESLCDIASSQDVYSSCLKWPQVYYHNREELAGMESQGVNLPFVPLPPGLNLALILPGNAEKRARKIVDDYPPAWAVNVMSRDQSRELTGLALELLNNGYYVYITQFSTEDTIWKRLRVGFFPTLDKAKEAQEGLKERFGLADAWVVKSAPAETLEFIGYLE